MTDTPGWTSPGSPEPSDEAAGPSGPPSAPVTAPPAAPQSSPQDAPQDTPPPHQGWGTPGPYGGAPYGGGPHPGQPYPGPGRPFPGWGAPPSPKPGVIPLRPLGVGEILDGAMSTVRKHWRTALGLSFGIAVLEQTVTALGQLWSYNSPHDVLALVARFATYPVAILLGIVATGLLTIVVSKAVVGENVTLGSAWAAARPRLAKLAGVTLLTVLVTVGIVLLSVAPLVTVLLIGGPTFWSVAPTVLLALAGLVVACWIGIQLSFAAPALMLEKQGVIASLSRSRRLVKGSWWRVFGITLLGQILIGVVAGIIAAPFAIVGVALTVGSATSSTPFGSTGGGTTPLVILLTSIGGVLGATLTIPVLAGINVLLYVDQRIRREALDIELARAAGLPESATGVAGPGPLIPGQSGPQGI
ncbi:hypothetical protein [Kitasatospora sp. MAP5-34]|uniref:DUF7544 domain-containing protein n=1 Tax=Kitasatospora sp. MAP5-34 TaxID=3035102 RepID=UPI002474B676|nr:hypothetical protein [Kitasatospora sp. MAP5-34]MDH6577204.1 hypothetical protein [Kitasatospora sp. MAP5-34]